LDGRFSGKGNNKRDSVPESFFFGPLLLITQKWADLGEEEKLMDFIDSFALQLKEEKR